MKMIIQGKINMEINKQDKNNEHETNDTEHTEDKKYAD